VNCVKEKWQNEIHVLAYFYHFSPEALWNMPRRERELWCSMVLRQLKNEERKMKSSNAPTAKKYKESI